MGNISDKVVEKITYYVQWPFYKNRAFCEIMLKNIGRARQPTDGNMAEPGSPQITIWQSLKGHR
jgi:hypothetical protein